MNQFEKLKPEDEGGTAAMQPQSNRATDAFQLLGAAKAAILISRSVSAEAIRTIQAIRDNEYYLDYGSKTFDEFLDKHPESPMSYYQFHQREQLLTKEGDLTFQLLNTLRIPAAKRKMLTIMRRFRKDSTAYDTQ